MITKLYLYKLIDSTIQLIPKQELDSFFKLAFEHGDASDQCTIKEYELIISVIDYEKYLPPTILTGEGEESQIKYDAEGLKINIKEPMHL